MLPFFISNINQSILYGSITIKLVSVLVDCSHIFFKTSDSAWKIIHVSELIRDGCIKLLGSIDELFKMI